MTTTFNPLPIKSVKDAAKEAQDRIDAGRAGNVFGLTCRWQRVNKAVLGSWQFNNIYVLGAGSGVGKSTILQMLESDFLDEEFNGGKIEDIGILHFALEMDAATELIRSAAFKNKSNYATLTSAFGKIGEIDYNLAKGHLDSLISKHIDFVEEIGNVGQMESTIDHYVKLHPNRKLVVGIDHTLLPNYHNEKDEIALIASVAKMALRVKKKYKAMVILISQLNTDIENPQRIVNAALQYPTKKDLHGSKSIYHVADFVTIINKPSSLGIGKYGNQALKTTMEFGGATRDILFWHQLKARNFIAGVIPMVDLLSEGTIIETDINKLMNGK